MESEPHSRQRAASKVASLSTARLPTGPTVSPELRLVFLREPPAFPGWLLIFLFAGAGAHLGPIDGWSWIGGATAIALIRVLIAIHALSPRQSARTDSWLGLLFVLTHLAQAALWMLLLGAPESVEHSGLRTGVSLVLAMWLAAACLRGWNSGWLAAITGWGAAALGTAIGLWDSQPTISIALVVLLPITAWAGLAPGKSRPAASTARRTTMPMVPVSGESTRRGLQLAIHAS